MGAPTAPYAAIQAIPTMEYNMAGSAPAAVGSRVLSLAEVIEEASNPKNELEYTISAAVPSIGSIGHSSGNCKPCGFLHKSGCVSGAQCNYCHLCDPGEKKRRQREKRETLRKAGRA